MAKSKGAQQPNRWIFITTGACVGRVTSESRCEFWSEDPVRLPTAFDPAALTPVDLARTPSTSKTHADVEVDDFATDGGMTTIGPTFPDGPYVGQVAVEEHTWQKFKGARQPKIPPPTSSGHSYEFLSVLYKPGREDKRTGKRYVGIHAVIQKTLPPPSKLVLVDLYRRGESKRCPKVISAWIDLDDPDICDPMDLGGLTDIDPEGKHEGSIFLETQLAKGYTLMDIKIPWYRGR